MSLHVGIPIAEIEELFAAPPSDEQVKNFLAPRISLLDGESLEDFDWPATVRRFRAEAGRVLDNPRGGVS